MRYGIVLPVDDPHAAIDLAIRAEAAGWDGVFVWDGIWGADPWIVMAAMAVHTERIKLGPLITPISRRRPWKLASEALTLDQVSRGRAILPLGLGAPGDVFAKVGEATDRKVRAELLDEGIDLLTGFWSGQPYSYNGKHFQIDNVRFDQTPVQRPRIPIWVVAAWPRPKSMQRVLRCDGMLPVKMTDNGGTTMITPDEIAPIKAFVDRGRSASTPFDIVIESWMPLRDRARTLDQIAAYAAAGATWWLDNVWAVSDAFDDVRTADQMRERIEQGPPQLA